MICETEDELVVRIPPVRRLGVVRVELQLRAVPVQVEHARVAIAVTMYKMPPVTPPSVKTCVDLLD